jgi:hypothetical protein
MSQEQRQATIEFVVPNKIKPKTNRGFTWEVKKGEE